MAAPDQPWERISMAFCWASSRTWSQEALSKKSTLESAKVPSGAMEKPTQDTRGRQYMPVTGVLMGTGIRGITWEPRASPPM